MSYQRKSLQDIKQSKRAIDFGNGAVKKSDGSHSIYMPHAMRLLTESDWDRVTNGGRKLPDAGYLKIVRSTDRAIVRDATGEKAAVWGSNPLEQEWPILYASYGHAAKRHQKTPKRGAARYDWNYLSPLAFGLLIESQGQGSHNLALRASHAPKDWQYAKDLEASLTGYWEITSYKGQMNFLIPTVRTLDEPLAGAMYHICTLQGTINQQNLLSGKTTLIIDIGMKTTDGAVIDGDGQIDRYAMRSIDYGAQQILEGFAGDITRRYPKLFQNANDIEIARLETGLSSGSLPYGSKFLDVTNEAAVWRETLAINTANFIENDMGGAFNYELIYLTGGGGGIPLRDSIVGNNHYAGLESLLPSNDFLLAKADKPEDMRFANVEGLIRYFAMRDNYNQIRSTKKRVKL